MCRSAAPAQGATEGQPALLLVLAQEGLSHGTEVAAVALGLIDDPIQALESAMKLGDGGTAIAAAEG